MRAQINSLSDSPMAATPMAWLVAGTPDVTAVRIGREPKCLWTPIGLFLYSDTNCDEGANHPNTKPRKTNCFNVGFRVRSTLGRDTNYTLDRLFAKQLEYYGNVSLTQSASGYIQGRWDISCPVRCDA